MCFKAEEKNSFWLERANKTVTKKKKSQSNKRMHWCNHIGGGRERKSCLSVGTAGVPEYISLHLVFCKCVRLPNHLGLYAAPGDEVGRGRVVSYRAWLWSFDACDDSVLFVVRPAALGLSGILTLILYGMYQHRASLRCLHDCICMSPCVCCHTQTQIISWGRRCLTCLTPALCVRILSSSALKHQRRSH